MELYTLVGMAVDEAEEVIPMDGRLIEKLEDEGTLGGLDKYLRARLPEERSGGEQ